MIPFNYYCSQCDFGGSSISTWGEFNYKKDSVLAPIHRKIGICYTCNAITPVEKLPDREYLNRLVESSKQNWVTDKLIEDEKKRAKLLNNRDSKARCLDCGSHDFGIVPNTKQPEERKNSNTPWRAGITHKNCGGRIYVKKSILNLYYGDRLPKRYYDIEGVEITSAI
jgi:hypothetical protein